MVVNRPKVRSNIQQKIAQAGRTLLDEGLSSLLRQIREFLKYHLESKWDFAYLQYGLEKELGRVPMDGSLTIRLASAEDLDRIRTELFPAMVGEQEYEKRYFDLLGQQDIRCFVAERDGRLVHYSWVFLDPRMSPIAEVPFSHRTLRPGDVFIGPVFTLPTARGLIYPQVLSWVVRYLKECTDAIRLVLFVRGTNLVAVSSYRRLGFTELENLRRRPVWAAAWKTLISTK